MADYYSQSCVALILPSVEAVAIAQRFYDQAIEYVDCEDETEVPCIEGRASQLWEELLSEIRDYTNVGFKFYAEKDVVYLGDDEIANVDQMTKFVQFLQKHFDLKEAVLITWANSCSKLRPGEFSGGAALVHQDHIEFAPAAEFWFLDKCKELHVKGE